MEGTNHVEFIEDDSLSSQKKNNTDEVLINTKYNESIGSSYSIDLFRSYTRKPDAQDIREDLLQGQGRGDVESSTSNAKRLLFKHSEQAFKSQSQITRWMLILTCLLGVCACILIIVYTLKKNSDNSAKIMRVAVILLMVALSMCCCICSCIKYKMRNYQSELLNS
jgi:hypothetical protein